MAGPSWVFAAGASWESEAGASCESEAGASWESEAGESWGTSTGAAALPFLRRGGRTGLTALARGPLVGRVPVSPAGATCSASTGLGVQSGVFRACIMRPTQKGSIE